MASSTNKYARGSKEGEPKESKRSLKRIGEHSDDEANNKEVVKKAKQSVFDDLKVANNKSLTQPPSGLTIKLKQPAPKKSEPKTELIKKASVFGESSDSDEAEEMPPEARMRMKNIGRDTQTSAGPNSFGKTRQGFCDSKKVFERQMKKVIEEADD